MAEEPEKGAKRISAIALNDYEYAHLERIATRRNITVEQWIEELIRRDIADYRRRSENIRMIIEEAAQHDFPTADIEQMLKEIESGYLENRYIEE